MNEKVSVNITTYNRGHLLVRCLDSILKQTYKNLEIVIADDGSMDNTEEIVKTYALKDDRIKYLKHAKNMGNACARNTAFLNSTGEYIAFMDDDDEWIDDKKIEKQLEIFKKGNEKLGIVCSSVKIIREKGVQEKIVSRPHNLVEKILAGNGIIYSPTVMTKQSILKMAGGFDTIISKGVDSDFYRTCIVKMGFDVYFMNEITTAVYEHDGSRMTPIDSLEGVLRSLRANLYILKKFFKYFVAHPKSFAIRLRSLLITFLIMLKIFFNKIHKNVAQHNNTNKK